VPTASFRITGFVQCVVQDPVVPQLLFMGADDGLYFSLNKGQSWARVPGKTSPHVPIMDLKIHATDHSLAIATFGRSLWVLDNLLPLRELAREPGKLNKSFVLFDAPDGVQAQMRSVDGIRFAADGEFKGDNRFPGIRIPVYLKPADPPAAKPAVADDVKDDKGKKGNKKKPAEPLAASVDTTSRKAPAVNI